MMNYVLELLVFVFNLSLSQKELDDDFVFRVVNGRPAKLGEVPYQVAFKTLRRSGVYKTFCGGTILAPSVIISAAHCFCTKGYSKISEKRTKAYAVAGNIRNRATFRYDSVDNGQWRKLMEVKFPAGYRFPANDVAVVIIMPPFLFNKYVSSIPVSSRHQEYKGTCIVTGYGRTSNKLPKKPTNTLLLAELQVLPMEMCNKIHHRDMLNFICTSSDISDIAKGDSGGPFVCKNTGDPRESPFGILVGVVCGRRILRDGSGSFFTRVSNYRNFIDRQILALSNDSTIMRLSILVFFIYFFKFV